MSSRLARALGFLCATWLVACGAADDAASGHATPSADQAEGGAGGSAGRTSTGGKGGATGGSAGGLGTAGSAGAPGGGASGASGHLAPLGSFDLTLTAVDASLPTGSGKQPSPSLGTSFRLDLLDHSTGSPWKAVVAPRWGTPTVFEGSVMSQGLLLSGAATVKVPGVTDVWQSFLLGLDKDGKLTGTVSAVGQESDLTESVGVSGKISGKGTLGPDVTPPAGKPGVDAGFASEALLPWEPISVRFAEPIAEADAKSHLALQVYGAQAPVTWSFVGGADKASGVVQASGFALAWTDLSSSKLELIPGYPDKALNPGSGFEKGLSLLSPPKATTGKSAVSFQGDYVGWGGASVVLKSEACDGPCAVLGPVPAAACDLPSIGLAGRLDVPEKASMVRVRYRVLLAGDSAPTTVAALSVMLARPGKAPVTKDVQSPLVMPFGGQFASAWLTAELPLPAKSGVAPAELGWAIRAGGFAAAESCGPTANAPTAPMTVLVDTISVE